MFQGNPALFTAKHQQTVTVGRLVYRTMTQQMLRYRTNFVLRKVAMPCVRDDCTMFRLGYVTYHVSALSLAWAAFLALCHSRALNASSY